MNDSKTYCDKIFTESKHRIYESKREALVAIKSIPVGINLKRAIDYATQILEELFYRYRLEGVFYETSELNMKDDRYIKILNQEEQEELAIDVLDVMTACNIEIMDSLKRKLPQYAWDAFESEISKLGYRTTSTIEFKD